MKNGGVWRRLAGSLLGTRQIYLCGAVRYSNGDEENGLYGNFSSKEEAFKKICVLAAKEAYVQNEDFDELRTCSVYFDACEYKADLHYDIDDTWCYYRVQELPDAERSDDRIRSIDEEFAM